MDNQYAQLEANYDPKTKMAVASTSREDRMGEVVLQEGWDLKAYLKNPLLLWMHDKLEPPIGKTKNIRVEGAGKRAKLVFEPLFHEVTEKAKAIKTLYEQGVLNSFSVGFRPIDYEGNTYITQELLEISAVTVPANADARMMAYKALTSAGFKDKVIQDFGIDTKVIDKLANMEKDIAKLQQAVKERESAPPQRYKQRTYIKVIARATDLIMEGDKDRTLENKQRQTLIKVIKLATEKVSHIQKDKLNGTNSRTN